MPGIEYIKTTMDLSPYEKLTWLEEANDFINRFVPEDKIRIWNKIHIGEVKIQRRA